MAFINGQQVEIDVPATIVDGRTLVPVRFISEGLGADVDWIGEHRIVKVIKN